jgi:XRE family aerobic/anaerobic benzoate catabolism transcriptional regulator
MNTHADRRHPHGLLDRLGSRVRHERTRCGFSRKQLADRSGISLRFLAQVEAGQANISLQRLEEVATALGVPLTFLLDPQPLEELSLPGELQHLLASRTPDEMSEILDWVTERFDQRKQRRVALLGLRGAGKSTVGRHLARALNLPFFELDALIEDAAGLSLQEIFELQGQAAFRELEHRTLVRFLSQHTDGVLATGGGIVTARETFQLLQRACVTVWLRARPEDHWNRVKQQGDQRPMQGHPAAMQELRSLLATRESTYGQADLMVQTSGRPVEDIAGSIAARLRADAPETWAGRT